MAYTDAQFKELMKSQEASRPWAQKNPEMAMSLAGALSAGGGMLGGIFGGGGLFGKPERREQVPMFSQEIMGLKNKMAPDIWGRLSGDEFDFEPIENMARQNFQGKTIPSIMARFNMGNNRNSSALMGALGQAGSGLDSQLAAMRQNYGLQRQNLLASLMGYSMTPSFQTDFRPRTPGGIEQGAGAAASLLPLLMMML